MIKLKSLIEEIYDNSIWYHGSPSGELKSGVSGIHLGTYKAAKEALESRIGIPVIGEWDGKRKYGETLLCGKKTLKDRNIYPTGFNCDAPEDDYYPNISNLPKYSDKSNISLDNKPSIKKYKIICFMNNSRYNPYNDFKANGYMRISLKKGNAKNGYYYKNESEDCGSISAVVPNKNCIKEI
jgi:hypothetical protein